MRSCGKPGVVRDPGKVSYLYHLADLERGLVVEVHHDDVHPAVLTIREGVVVIGVGLDSPAGVLAKIRVIDSAILHRPPEFVVCPYHEVNPIMLGVAELEVGRVVDSPGLGDSKRFHRIVGSKFHYVFVIRLIATPMMMTPSPPTRPMMSHLIQIRSCWISPIEP